MVPSVEPRRARRVGGATGCARATIAHAKPAPALELEDRSSIRDGAGVEKARRRGDGVAVAFRHPLAVDAARRPLARLLQSSRRGVLF